MSRLRQLKTGSKPLQSTTIHAKVNATDCDAGEIAEGVRSQLQHGLYPQSTIYSNRNAAQKITNIIAKINPNLKPPMSPDSLENKEKGQ
jgi:hypothetical protein